MPKIWKEIIRPGTYWYIDQETQAPRRLKVTADLVKHFGQTGTQMLAAGLSIPVPDEHQLDAKPLTKAEKAAKQLKNNSGWVEKYGMKGDHLFALLDITDPQTANKIKDGSIRWVSPWLNSFTDGDGRTWDGAISHVALTSRPRITKQAPFPNLAAAMSLAGRLMEESIVSDDRKKSIIPVGGSGLYLSLSNLLVSDGAALKPKFPVAFSLFSGSVKLGGEMVKPKKSVPKKEGLGDGDIEGISEEDGEDDVGHEGKGEGEGGGGAMMDEGNTEGNGKEGTPNPEGEITAIEDLEDSAAEAPEGGGDFTKADACCDLLRMLGLDVPEGTDEEAFVHEVYEAAKMKLHSMKKKPGAEMSDEGNQPNQGRNNLPANPTVQEPPPMFMSLENIKKIQDPTMRQMASAMFSQNQQNVALRTKVMREESERRKRRAERIASNMPKSAAAAKEKLLAQVADARFSLSLGNDGSVIDPLKDTLDILEAGIVQIPAMLMGGSGEFTEQPQPRLSSEVTKEQVTAAADAICPEPKRAM